MNGRRPLDSGLRLEIDRIACDGYGTCAELLPEGIDLDEWGYPIIAPGTVPLHLVDLAKRAVDSCPVLALRLVPCDARVAASAPQPGPVLAARPDRTEGTPPWPPRPASKSSKRPLAARRR
jgi:ferredoxin